MAESSSQAEVDYLDLCRNSVRSLEDVVASGKHLLNPRQCKDLSSKVSETTGNVQELVLYCEASITPFRPALETFRRCLDKAEALVRSCAEEDWLAAAVFQVDNENAFQMILLDVSLCYNVLYELAKSTSTNWNNPPEDLRRPSLSVFTPAPSSVVGEDRLELQKRLDDLANGHTKFDSMDYVVPGKISRLQTLANYLLVKMRSTLPDPQVVALDIYSALLWRKFSEPMFTWGSPRFLGSGSGASGVLSTTWLGIPCAKKEFHGQHNEGFFLKEAGILAHLKHPCVVNFVCCGNGLEKGHRFIAMELMEKSLADLIAEQKGTHFPLHVVVDMMVQIARGVCYLHGRGIAHRDLKPQNVVVSKMNSPLGESHYCVKLVDFGMSKTKVEASKVNTMSGLGIGTTWYRAPEVGREAHPNGSGRAAWFKADAYSFAMTCAHLLSLKIPFGEMQANQLYLKLINGERPSLPGDCPQEIVLLLEDCWNTRAESRPNFGEVCTRLEKFKYALLKGSVGGNERDQCNIVGYDFIKRKVEGQFSHQVMLVDSTDDDKEEILAMMDVQSDPPSSDGDDMSWKVIDGVTDASASEPVLEAKHEVFLSHSGQQKDFTELLCRELENWGYSPFFDKREDSLPKGKRFPELIFRAARQCRVAVLILSEAFFTKTKWPMLELAAFVEAQEESRKEKRPAVDILPVYLGLTQEDCRKDENVERWQKRWEEMENMEWAEKMKEMDELGRAETQAQCKAAREGGELRSQKWKDAMKVLGPSNEIEYEQSSRQAGLIDRVVSAVRGLLRCPNMASDPGTQAKGRICESLIEKISRTEASSNGARVVGVYGMGGMGKTTFCKELCCELYKRFEGRVCHAELGRLSEIELKKKVVQKLTDVNHCSLSSADDSKVTEYVRTRMTGEKVFLALDDVLPESKEEAMVYVEQAQYNKGSIVMVTAPSIHVLLSLSIKRSDCFAMPELEEEDARRLFLHHAAPGFQSQGSVDEQCIRRCIYECRFTRDGKSGGHFLPLALKVLGEQMQGMGENPRKWVESLSRDGEFDLDRKIVHPIFYILGRGYDSLQVEDQLLFMDSVLCNPQCNPLWRRTLDEPLEFGTLFEWLSVVHYGTTSEESSIRDRLQGLKARALLEDIGDGRCGVDVHALYREFAEFEASRGASRRVLWPTKSTKLPTNLVKKPSGNCWSGVERVGIVCNHGVKIPVDGVKWQHFANVVVLVLRIDGWGQFDLQGLQCLRSVVVEANAFTIIGLGKMRNLEWLELDGVRTGPALEEIGRLTKLQMLRVRVSWYQGSPTRLAKRFPYLFVDVQLNLEKCPNLRELVVEWSCLQALPDLGGMKSLRKVDFCCPTATEGLGGLGSQLSALQELRLSHCRSLRDRLPRLHEVVSLEVLHVNGLPKLEVFPDIRMLTRLRRLTIEELPNLVEVRGLGELVALEELKLWYLPKVRELPKMRSLTKLRWIRFQKVGEVWEQVQLLDMVPSQLRYLTLSSKYYIGQCSCELDSEKPSEDIFGDTLDLYECSGGTVLRDIDPRYPNWCVAPIL